MRVALVCPYDWDKPGGVRSHISSLARSLLARGHEVLVIAPGHATGATEGRQDFEVRRVARAVGVPANRSVAPISFGPIGFSRVRRTLAAFQPDVVHVHEPMVPSVSLEAVMVADAPLIGTFHAAAEGSLLYGSFAPVLRRLSDRLTIRTAVSAEAERLAARYLGGRFERTPNGIESDLFAEASKQTATRDRSVLFLGRIEQRKGLDILIEAVALADTKPRVVVAGDGPARRRCASLAERLDVDANFIGTFHEDEKVGLYGSASVYCAPNLGRESFGIVLLEAMASGTPVVCSDIPGFRDAAGDAARFAAPGDPADLARALDEVLQDEQLAAGLSTQGLQRARDFDWRALVVGVENLYSKAASGAA